ncbi:hypothetical protein ACHAWF_015267 [Thalassiosira exigua]
MRKGYGSTGEPQGRGGERGSSIEEALEQEGRRSLPRNESAGGTTLTTNESEPLLGVGLLLGNDDEEGEAPAGINPKWLSPDGADASTIEKVASDQDTCGASARGDKAATPKRSGSPRKAIHRPESDPHIGTNVITQELDTLAYSRDQDESTLLTNDNFKKHLSSVDEEGGKKGLLQRIFSSADSTDPPYMLVGLGLAVGIGLCTTLLLAYLAYNRHHGNPFVDNNTTSSSEGTWHGVPFKKVSRESFGDPISSIFDVSLFHSSLLYGGHVPQEINTPSSKRAPGATEADSKKLRNGNETGRRLTSASPKPFLRVPFPTGAFWTNLMLLPRNQNSKQQPPKQVQANQYSYPIVAYPYSYQWSSHGKLQASYSASRRVVKATSIQDAFAPDMTLGSVEDIHTRHVVKFDELSVTLRFSSGDQSHSRRLSGHDSDDYWETYIVQGSPYITVNYVGLSPELTALSDFDDISCPTTMPEDLHYHQPQEVETNGQPHQRRKMVLSSSSSTTAATDGKKLGICTKSMESTMQTKVITGVQFIVTTKEKRTWLIFASEPITFHFNQAARRVIKSKEKYGGIIRLALVPASSNLPPDSTVSSGEASNSKLINTEELMSSTGVKRLIYHAGAYPIGGSVSWNFRSGVGHSLAASTQPSVSSKKEGHRRMESTLDEHARRSRQHRMTSEADPKENNVGRITFTFDTVHMTASSPNTDVPLLMLSLPHHVASISSAAKLLLRQEDFDIVYQCIKGSMVPVVGSSWSYEEELTSIGFGDETLSTKTSSPTSTSVNEATAISTLDQSVRDLLLQTVESDLKLNLPVLSNGAYGFGKQIARLAQLAHIAKMVDAANAREVEAFVDRIKNAKNSSQTNLAHQSSVTTSPMTNSGTAMRGYALLEKYLTIWLGEKHLAYDAQLGGILSKEGMDNIDADFGNARYNDHHFHYGYTLYAAAILGRKRPEFIAQYGPFVDALFYDVAHSSTNLMSNSGNGIFFPTARHKSWFDGHSFASGLFPFANGKSQESSSEAVNCYYGAYLWSRVRWGTGNGDTQHKMVDFTRLLLAMEITGAKTYWHMTPPLHDSGGRDTNRTARLSSVNSKSLIPEVYNSAFRQNYMVGNLGMTDATCTTWFGTESIYVHLINFMPVTSITNELFDPAYVKGEQSVMSSGSGENSWEGYALCNKAIVDPNNAWVEAQDLVSAQLDPGLSKSQVLFWVSTREGFSPETSVEVPVSGDAGDDSNPSGTTTSDQSASMSKSTTKGESSSLASCTSHAKCVADELMGSCCPTNEGVFLSCCT